MSMITANKRDEIKRLDVWIADLGKRDGSEQSGVRPILIIQNDRGNKFAPTVQVAPITSSRTKKKLPTHVTLPAEHCGLEEDSVVLFEQATTIDKSKLQFKASQIPEDMAWLVDRAILISFGVGMPDTSKYIQ